MSFESLGTEGIDYLPCRYGRSKLMFRGPRKKLDQPYVVFLGGTETYGKFVEEPMSELLEGAIGRTTVNFGHLNAGVDAFLNDPPILEISQGADAVVIQVMGAQNMSNRLYTVHPRRNDRFLKASKFLETLYKNIDFTQFHYTRHLLNVLREESIERFGLVVEELQAAWVSRMQTLISAIHGEVVLLWVSDRAPNDSDYDDPLRPDPLFITQAQLDALDDKVAETLIIHASEEEIVAGKPRMVFSPLEEPIAQEMLGPVVHETAARALHNIMSELLD